MAGNETISWLSSELLQCDICLENFLNPKMLDCGHSFCLHCIKGYIQGKKTSIVICPTCREETKLTAGGPEALRNDFRAKKIEGLISEKQTKKLEHLNLCSFCETNNVPIAAKKYCLSCCKRFCEDCLAKHSRNEIFKEHSIIDSFTLSPRLLQKQTCREHVNETSGFLCKTCDQLVCTYCLLGAHNGHVVVDVTTAVKNEQTKFTEIKAGMVETTNQRYAALGIACDQAIEGSRLAITERTEEVIKEAKQQEQFLLEELAMLQTMKKKDVESECEKSLNRLTAITNLTEMIEFTSNINSHTTIYSIAKFIKADSTMKLGSFEQRNLVQENQGDEIVYHLQNLADIQITNSEAEPVTKQPIIKKSAKNERSKSLGTSSNSTSDGGSDHSEVQVTRPVGVRLSNPQIQRPRGSKPYLIFCVNGMGDALGKLKDPIGVGELHDGKLIVCEWANRRLQVFSPSGEPLRAILSGQISPQGIVVTVKGNILVSDSNQKKIFAFNPSGKPLSKAGIGKFINPCGLAFSRQGNIIVSDTSEHSVTVYKNDQAVAFKLGTRNSTDSNLPSDYQFRNPLYVACGPNNEIIVSDSDNHCVKVFDSQGRFLTRMGGRQGSGDGQLSFPRGVCIDSNGIVIVADRNNDRICLFNMQGVFLRHMLTREDGIVSPYAVAITSSNKLMVTESESRRAAFKLFQP